MKNRILLVEDEVHIQEAIKLNLELENYEVAAVDNGIEALKLFKEQRFNLIILDVMLPEMDGFQICEKIRLENQEIPVLFLTAKGNIKDKVRGLKYGADDYLTKPFNLEELLLRINNLIKRSVKSNNYKQSNTYQFGKNKIDFQNYKATNVHGEITLTKKETMLLKLLIDRKNQVVSRQQILQTVWGYDVYPTTRTIDNFILNFRKYFEEDPKNPAYFHSMRGVGYLFKI